TYRVIELKRFSVCFRLESACGWCLDAFSAATWQPRRGRRASCMGQGMTSSSRARPRAIDFHAHIIVPEVSALAAEHNIFSELPTDPGVTDEMRSRIKDRAVMVLARMSDLTDRIVNMDAMGVDVQVLSASLVHQGLEWADAQTSLRLARTTNDWI